MKLRAVWLVLLLAACGDPAYVSLGRNAQSVASSADTGSPDASTLASACQDPIPNDPLSPISFGCAIDPSLMPPSELECEHGPEMIPVGTSCVQRQPTSCPEALGDPARLQRMVFDVIARCTDLAYKVTATFTGGCATAFSIQALELPVATGVSECVAARLSAERYDCAGSSECAYGSTYPIIAR
jgi:hypothetical protein